MWIFGLNFWLQDFKPFIFFFLQLLYTFLINWAITMHTLIKKETKFSTYTREFRWERLQSYIRGRASTWDRLQSHIYEEGLVSRNSVSEEMRKHLTIYEEAVSHIYLCTRSHLNFLIYGENFLFFCISVVLFWESYSIYSVYMLRR